MATSINIMHFQLPADMRLSQNPAICRCVIFLGSWISHDHLAIESVNIPCKGVFVASKLIYLSLLNSL